MNEKAKFENTFNGAELSLWLNEQKITLSNQESINANVLENKNFSSIKLMAKNGTPFTKLIFSITSESNAYILIYYSLYKSENTIIQGAEHLPITTTISGQYELDLSQFNSNTFGSGGYIELNFESGGNKFNISLKGYYNK